MSSSSGALLNRNRIAKRSVIYLVRHGESIGNVTRTFLPPHQDALSGMGKMQVELLGKWLSTEKLTRIYSSDYPRALDTSKAILAHNSSGSKFRMEIQKDARLRERKMGIFEGKNYSEALTALVASGKRLLEFEIPEGETLDELANRAEEFFRSLIRTLLESGNTEERVLVVSHSFVLIKLLQFLTESERFTLSNWDYEKDFKLFQNASFVKLLLRHDQERMHVDFQVLHETRHLESIRERDTLVKFSQSTEEAKKLVGCIQT